MSIAEKHATITANNDAILESVQKVYDVGYAKGQTDGSDVDTDVFYQQGVADGRTAEHKAFWDAFQQNGNRQDYTYGFAGHGWDRDNFFPMHNLTPTTLNTCFHSFNRNDPNWQTFDMVERLSECGVTLDTSASINNTSLFMWARVGRVGVIDCTGTTTHTLNGSFGYGYIHTIDLLRVKPENVFSNTFTNNTELQNITIDGTIGNDISFQWQSKLTAASAKSVITHLQPGAGKTVRFHTNVWALLDAEGDTSPNGTTWRSYVTEDLGWDI